MPREPVNSQNHLSSIRHRLLAVVSQEDNGEESAAESKTAPGVVIPLELPVCHNTCHTHHMASERLAAN